MKTQVKLLIFLILLSIASFLFSLCEGSASISLQQIFTLNNEIILFLRLPRTITAFVTGGLLGLAGSLMQILVRNPLADPYVLGVSGGAAVVTLLFSLLGFSGIFLSLGAFMGSLVAIFLVFVLAKNKHHWSSQRLLLVGIALASGFSALISFLLFISPDHALRSSLFWLMGDLSETQFPWGGMLILLIGIIYAGWHASALNVLTQGEKQAISYGVNTKNLQLQIYFLTSLLTATAVTLAGCVGFVGLIVPHLFRLIGGFDHRYLLPGCALLGGSLLTIADTVSRTLWAPVQLPVGMMMALIGIPVFLFLLLTQKSHA